MFPASVTMLKAQSLREKGNAVRGEQNLASITAEQLVIDQLGESHRPSPLQFESDSHSEDEHFVTDDHRVLVSIDHVRLTKSGAPLSYEEAGPREQLFFNPAETTAAFVTCGGLSPGLNNVIRSAYYELAHNYGVPHLLGVRNGYKGLNPQSGLELIKMDASYVDAIDQLGGTILGTSRGPQDPRVMVDRLVAEGVNILFCLGGDGTQRGALTLYQEITRRQLPISIVGIPKTIDNDIPFVRLSFGYVTALEQASQAITCAHVEARDAVNGVGLVKLMGRHAGFIAAGASVISQEVNFTLVPEIKFDLEGEQGLLETLRRRIEAKGHAVIVVAEGAGQHLFSEKSEDHDASGNTLSQDIGEYLRARIKSHFAEHNVPLSLKYIDPSYTIRSVPAVGYDRFLCDQMARHAVHAAMAGKTGLLIGQEHHKFIHVPIQTVVNQTKRMDVHGDLWRAVLQCTGQPRW